ncbi:hypothetical protein PYCCODRAFT_1466514 [Trametes coccinea BRFM310]|uniref:Uncharacterized protein n=1 Tax=Trametes coccinea (strain BRFM310) TaxID=1353009 RepID=A0A1Y2ISJ8_TRAC3|nr:hypothetical protein PYCCODRAFT_1466514 [Trametes coccinea BRFM310]
MLQCQILRVGILPMYRLKFSAEDCLSLTRGNWYNWKDHVLDVLTMCNQLDEYLSPTFACPDVISYTVKADNWTCNNEHMTGWLHLNCTPSEQKFIKGLTIVSSLWTTLKSRHTHQGAHVQIVMLCELLALHSNPSKSLVNQAVDAVELCQCTLTMGELDSKSLAKVIILNMLQDPSCSKIQSQIADHLACATKSPPYTMVDIGCLLQVKQMLLNGSGPSSNPAFAVQAHKGSGRQQHICSNCKHTDHAMEDCDQKGSTTEHRKEEIQACIAAKRGKPHTSTPSSATGKTVQCLYDQSGKAYFILHGTLLSKSLPLDATHATIPSALPLVSIPEAPPLDLFSQQTLPSPLLHRTWIFNPGSLTLMLLQTSAL